MRAELPSANLGLDPQTSKSPPGSAPHTCGPRLGTGDHTITHVISNKPAAESRSVEKALNSARPVHAVSLRWLQESEQRWAKKNKDEYAELLKTSGRSAWYDATYAKLPANWSP